MLDHTPSTPVLAMPRSAPAWITDIAKHAGLTRAFSKDARRKTDIAEELKQGRKPGPAYVEHKHTGLHLRLLPLPDTEPDTDPEPLVNDGLMQEYVVLTKRQKERRIYIRRLEKQILAARPKTRCEAVLFLDFLSQMIASRNRFDRNAVSAAMRECAATLERCTVAFEQGFREAAAT